MAKRKRKSRKGISRRNLFPFALKPKIKKRLGRIFFSVQLFAVLAIGLLLFYKPASQPVRHPEFREAERRTSTSLPTIKQRSFVEQHRTTPQDDVKAVIPPVKRAYWNSSPKIVFVIDDIGNTLNAKNELFALGDNVTYAVLPFLPYSKYFAAMSQKTGAEVILHLPLEPQDGTIPGPGLITDRMSPDYILEMIEGDLGTVPYHVGVNNHMGSRGTADSELMEIILRDLKRRGLFFLDSQTTAESTARDIADQIGLPVLKRDVFLDNVDDPAAIRNQIDQVRDLAGKKGAAVAIGHYRPSTLSVLIQEIPKLKAEGFEIISLSELIDYQNR